MGKGDGTCGQRPAMVLSASPAGGPFGDLTQMSPSQVDEKWAAESMPGAKLRNRRESLASRIADRDQRGWNVSERDREKLEQLDDLIVAEDKRLEPFEAEWRRRGGWTRAYLVTNDDGHIHRSTNCQSLHRTTQLAWLPELSGADDEQIIAHAGFSACTFCYPDAPTHPSFIKGQKEAEAAEKAKQDARCPGSGTYAASGSYNPRLARPWARCPDCGEGVSVTSTGKLRAHKRK